MVHSGVQTESIFASVHGGWHLIQQDPVRILFAAAGVLALQAASVAVVFQTWRSLGFFALVGLVVAVWLARVVLSTPLRAAAILAGSSVFKLHFHPMKRTPSLLVVWLLSSGLELLVLGIALLLTVGPAEWFLARGTWWTPVLLIIVAAPVAVLISALIRCVFAYAAIEATAGRKGPVEAIALGNKHLWGDFPAVVTIVLIGECLVAFGGLLCGAGALPGTPYADLALLHRWYHRTEETE